MNVRLQAHLDWFAHLSPATLTDIGTVYAANCRFRDPFNDVRGLEQARRIYAHMFETTTAPRFVIERVIAQEAEAAVFWRFQCGVRGQQVDIAGMSHLRLDGAGLIVEHIDYWDSADLFNHFPLVGSATRWLKRRLALPAAQ